MSIEQRNSFKINKPGPYLGIVKNHLDSTRMGGLEVELIRGYTGNTEASSGLLVPCFYLSPFYGVTSIEHIGDASKYKNFKDTQQSYGMWMVPPDVGTTVMVIFIEGEYNQGYWMGCVPELFQNYMIPGLAYQALSKDWLTPEEDNLYGTNILPVAEYNKRQNKQDPVSSTDSIQKPIHPFAKKLAAQGLLTDPVRGITSSSARRETPSAVFGISTPGPLDIDGNRKPINYGGRLSNPVPVNRMGGSTFVMDDGAVDEDGVITNELVRIRTRTGHQILLHNTDDLIYIANSKGTAWIELTSNGKIDIFAQDSVSIHTEKDFNIRAGNDVNIEAKNNVNIHSINDIKLQADNDLSILILNNAKITAKTELFLNSIGTVSIFGQTSVKTTSKTIHNLGAEGIRNTSKKIYNNSPGTAAEQAGTSLASSLEQYVLPMRSESAGWANKIYYKNGTITTTIPRVPTHEPWPLHENKV